MRRHQLTPDEFAAAVGHAWSVAWLGNSEEDDGSHGGSVDVDLFCHFRLTDGKVWFVTVPCPDLDSLSKVVAAANRANDVLSETTRAGIAKLTLKPGTGPCGP